MTWLFYEHYNGRHLCPRLSDFYGRYLSQNTKLEATVCQYNCVDRAALIFFSSSSVVVTCIYIKILTLSLIFNLMAYTVLYQVNSCVFWYKIKVFMLYLTLAVLCILILRFSNSHKIHIKDIISLSESLKFPSFIHTLFPLYR